MIFHAVVLLAGTLAGAVAAVSGAAKEEKATDTAAEPAAFFTTARRHLEDSLSIWSWDDDVEFLSLSWVEFQR